MGRRGRQHRDLARPSRRGKLQPGHELADVFQPGLAPVQAPEAEELPVVLEIEYALTVFGDRPISVR
jgi:hypothetical protein